MSDPVVRAGADLRLLRAAVFTAVCVLLSAGGHMLASCATVPLWTLGAGFAVVFAVAAPLAGRERSLPGIAAGLAVGQLALHALFGLGQLTAGTATRQAGTEGQVITFAAKLICNQPHAMSAAQARRVITDAGLDPAVHPLQTAAPTPAPPASGASPRSRTSCRPRCRCCSATCSRPWPRAGCCGGARRRCGGRQGCRSARRAGSRRSRPSGRCAPPSPSSGPSPPGRAARARRPPGVPTGTKNG
ncbi:hypothetical protein ACFQ2B_16175 [Streptomyces stramineus]